MAPWVALGVIGGIIVVVVGVAILAAVVLVTQRRKRSRIRLQDDIHQCPVQYRARQQPQQDHTPRPHPPTPATTQQSIEVASNPAYTTSTHKTDEAEGGEDGLEEYVEVVPGKQPHPLPGAGEGVYEEITKESLMMSEEDGTYVATIDEFLPPSRGEGEDEKRRDREIEKKRLRQGNHLFTSTDRLLLEEDDIKVDLSTLPVDTDDKAKKPGRRKNDPHYINDLDSLGKEIAKADLAQSETETAAGGRGRAGYPSYVNDLQALVRQGLEEEGGGGGEGEVDGVASDEDEEGYTVYNPKRTTRRGKGGRGAGTGGGGVVEEEIYYQNTSPVQGRIPDEEIYCNTAPAPVVPGRMEPSSRPYMNDLQSELRAAREREREGERGGVGGSGKRHNPYVNDISGLMVEALREEQQQQKRDPATGAAAIDITTGEGGREGRDVIQKKKHHYVNDLASLLPPHY